MAGHGHRAGNHAAMPANQLPLTGPFKLKVCRVSCRVSCFHVQLVPACCLSSALTSCAFGRRRHVIKLRSFNFRCSPVASCQLPAPSDQVTGVPWWLGWDQVEELMTRPLTVPQPGGHPPVVLPPVPGFLGGFCSTMEVTVQVACRVFDNYSACQL